MTDIITVPVSLLSATTDTVDIRPNSHYRVDYILYHFQNRLVELLKSNANIASDPKFADVIEKYDKLVEKITAGRAVLDGDDAYAPKTHNNTITNGIFDETSYFDALQNPDVKNFLKSKNNYYLSDFQEKKPLKTFPTILWTVRFINRGTVEYTTNTNFDGHDARPTTQFDGGNWAWSGYYGFSNSIEENQIPLNFYFHHWDSSKGTKLSNEMIEINNLITELSGSVTMLDPSAESDENITKLLNVRDKDTQNILTQIRTEIESGEYDVMLDGIQILLRDLLLPEINKVTDVLSVENEILKSIPSPSEYYENIFEKSQLEPAIVKPNNEKETVPRNKIYEELEKALKHDNENGYDSSLLLNILGKDTDERTSKILQNLKNFNKKVNEKLGIPDNSILKKIMYSLIYSENDEPIAKYLNESEREMRNNIQRQKEITYTNSLFLIKGNTAALIDQTDPNGWQNPLNPVNPYTITVNGVSTDSETTLASIYNKKQDATQRGGSNDSVEETEKNIIRLIKNNEEINKMNDEINKGFFSKLDNKYFYMLEQRNQFLIEMMNILMVSNRLVSGSSGSYQIFNETLGEYIKKFKTELKTAWNILNSQIDISGDIINDMVSRGSVLTSQIKSFLDSTGIPRPKEYSDNPIINRLGLINTVRTISEIANLPYTDIVKFIRNIYSNSMDISSNNRSVRDIYKNMKKYYGDLKNFQLKMNQLNNEIISENTNVNNIIEGIGNIVSENISVIDTYTKQITLLMSNLDIKINNIDHMNDIKNHMKIKRDKLRSSLTSLKHNLIEFKTLESPSDANLVQLSTNMTKYIDSIITRSQNIDSYTQIMARTQLIEAEQARIEKIYEELNFYDLNKFATDGSFSKIHSALIGFDQNNLFMYLSHLYLSSYLNDFIRNYLDIDSADIDDAIKLFIKNNKENIGVAENEFKKIIENDYDKFYMSILVRKYDLMRKLIVLLERSSIEHTDIGNFNLINDLQKEIHELEFDIGSIRNSLYAKSLDPPTSLIRFINKIKTSTDISRDIVADASENIRYINELLLNIRSLKSKVSINEYKSPVDIQLSLLFSQIEYDYSGNVDAKVYDVPKYKQTIPRGEVIFDKLNGNIISIDDVENLEIILTTIKFIIENYHYLNDIDSLEKSTGSGGSNYNKQQELYKLLNEFMVKIKSNRKIPNIHARILIINDFMEIYESMSNLPVGRIGYDAVVGEFKTQIKKYISQIRTLFDDVLKNIKQNNLNNITTLIEDTFPDLSTIRNKYTSIGNDIKGLHTNYTRSSDEIIKKLKAEAKRYDTNPILFNNIQKNMYTYTIEETNGRPEDIVIENDPSSASFNELFENSNFSENMYTLNEYDNLVIKVFEKAVDTSNTIDDLVIDITDKIQYYNQLYAIVTKVMFDRMFYTRPFVQKNILFKKYTSIYDSYKTLNGMFSGKVISMIKKYNKMKLLKGQINAFNAFTMALDRKIGNEKLFDERNVYLKMSFGLINFYRQTISTILEYLDSQDHSEMCQVHKYLFETHYISLKRINKLFEWIYQYQLSILANESARPPATKSDRILMKRIDLLKTQGTVSKIFAEFNNIRYMLDDYRSTLMNKVTMHLRINDFYSADVPDPTTTAYVPRDLPFSIDSNTNRLIINENKLPIEPEKLRKLKESTPELQNIINQSGGVKFDNAYDIKNFPNADIISNYMSLATNIKNGKGVAIMTYGYSGVGKTATIFGNNDPDPNKRMIGLLQSTLEEFNSKIKLRIYEMYGLGTQYNFYWNPAQTDTEFPDIYQILIHHKLDVSNQRRIGADDYYAITNRSDVFSYISELQKPGDPDFFPTIKKSRSKRNTNVPDGKMTHSTYVDITRDQYMKFDELINKIDTNRKKGIDVDIFFKGNTGHKQIKSTVNNPESSRSIVIYEFQIESESEPGKYTPFIIYDLPGKEDLYKTYIQPTVTSETPNAIVDIRGDTEIPYNGTNLLVKEKKSTYILNPLLLAGFDNNYEACIDNIKKLDPYEVTKPDGTKDMVYPLSYSARQSIIANLMNTSLGSNTIDTSDPSNINMIPGPTPQIREYYDVTKVNKFADLFEETNLSVNLRENGAISKRVITYKLGMLAAAGAANLKNKDGSKLKPIYIFYVGIIMSLIKVFLKYKLFDVIAAMIKSITSWSFDQIYMFFEAYYINENVLGLLDYLVKKIVKVDQSFPSQTNDSYGKTLQDNFTKLNNYLYASNFRNDSSPMTSNYNFYKIDDKFLSGTDDATKEFIEYLKNEYQLNSTDGLYGKKDRARTQNRLLPPSSIDLLLHNKSSYDSNKLFRSGNIQYSTKYFNPDTMKLENMQNTPFIYDILMPYKSKIEYYYLFYVMSNVKAKLKAEEQIKLLDNSTPFIKALYDSRSNDGEKKTCV